MIILLHSSKTMRPPASNAPAGREPVLLEQARILAAYLKTLSTKQLGVAMRVSPKLTEATHALIAGWTDTSTSQRPAIDSFLGDIYSGLQTGSWSEEDRRYADNNLRILSGLYGILRPLDGIYPYRLEMGYRLPRTKFPSLYAYWADSVAAMVPTSGPIVNLAAIEYSRAVTDHIDQKRVIAPRFLTISPTTGKPEFVVVHAKIARGAFANWMIKNRIEDPTELKNFADIGYRYSTLLSADDTPVFVCQEFGGIGLSVRLS